MNSAQFLEKFETFTWVGMPVLCKDCSDTDDKPGASINSGDVAKKVAGTNRYEFPNGWQVTFSWFKDNPYSVVVMVGAQSFSLADLNIEAGLDPWGGDMDDMKYTDKTGQLSHIGNKEATWDEKVAFAERYNLPTPVKK